MRQLFHLFLAILLIGALAAGAVHADKGSAYTELTTPAGDDTVIVTDVDDATMATSGTTKKAKLSNLPVSTAVQNALNDKLADTHPAASITDAGSGAVITSTERTKLEGIAAGAQVNPPAATAQEITDGTETAVRSISPAQLKSAAETHAPGADYPGVTADGADGLTILGGGSFGAPIIINGTHVRGKAGEAGTLQVSTDGITWFDISPAQFANIVATNCQLIIDDLGS
ncbi:MAG: hypothetical protein M0Q95_17885 [Porticoccaceae bacterium]|nr:hypothetical protein [Porticoccaceae bacterium]